MQPLKNFVRWFKVAWVAAWALVCAFVVVALSLNARDEPVDWKIIAGIAALAAIALPFGLLIIRRISKTLDRAGETKPVEPPEQRGRILRLLTGLFGMVCIGSGLFAGLNGKLYEGGSREAAKAIDAPSWHGFSARLRF